MKRQPGWTESVAVGSKPFAAKIKTELGVKGIGKKAEEEEGDGDMFRLKEDATSFCLEKARSKEPK